MLLHIASALFLLICINTLRLRQDGRLFPEDIFKIIFFNENVQFLIKISLTFVPKAQINNIPALVEIMAWRQPGDKPLSEPMMVSLLTHICVTWPQWVKYFLQHTNYFHLQLLFQQQLYHITLHLVSISVGPQRYIYQFMLEAEGNYVASKYYLTHCTHQVDIQLGPNDLHDITTVFSQDKCNFLNATFATQRVPSKSFVLLIHATLCQPQLLIPRC